MANWYECSFGSDYMIVYRHRNWEQAELEVQRMAGWLGLPAGSEILDIGCGTGRHALALARLGYRVTGVDLSEQLLEKAREANGDGKIKALIHGDMRKLPVEDERFRATVNLFTSFGYFPLEADNRRVLREIRRVLRKDGQFLIDFLNPDYVVRHLVPRSERIDAESGQLIEEVRSVADGWVVKQIAISPQTGSGQGRRYEERVRLLPLEWFETWLTEAGLKLEGVYGDYEGHTYDRAESPRMIMKGRVAL